MNARAVNYFRWAIVVGFLLVPPLLVRHFVDAAPAVRMITDSLLIAVFTSMGLYLTFRPIIYQRGNPKGRDGRDHST
jgi:hypothetical protein